MEIINLTVKNEFSIKINFVATMKEIQLKYSEW